ncbi:MAG: hypothetical protein ACOH5I_22360 [Oligoflexus sp.]
MELRRIVVRLGLLPALILGVITPIDSVESQGLRTTVAGSWQGEPFASNEGGVVFQISLNQNLSRIPIETVVVKFYSPAGARYYLLPYRPAMQTQGAAQVWRLPAGHYKLYDIEFRNRNGTVARWDGEDSPVGFNIQSGRLANFGRWYAIALPNKSVRVIFRETQPSQSDSGSGSADANTLRKLPAESKRKQALPSTSSNRKSRQDFRSLSQGNRPTSRLPSDSINPKKDGGIRAVYKYQRKLDMVYKVNLLRANRFSSVFSESIKRYDNQLRSCFLERFGEFETLQGIVRFKFIYSGSEQLIKNLILTENTMGDKEFVECLYWQILAINFPVRENIVGDLSFQFHLQTQ